ncbi:unnamed protein product, partial [Symbiodinium sp. CCMP2592]
IISLTQLSSAAGARVPPNAVVGGGPHSSEWGKRHGTAPREGHNIGSRLPEATKRAYRRARNRAARSLEGGTFYRGQWHTSVSLNALAHVDPSPLLKHSRRRIPGCTRHPTIRVFSWNTGGLSGPAFQELVAWLDSEATFDAVILQETHWQSNSDFRSGKWLCTHSSGYDSNLAVDRYGGILIMLRQDVFSDPSINEIYPGRLLHARALHKKSQLNVDIIGLYQHVHRPNLTPDLNQKYRADIWGKLSALVNHLPQRNPLVLGGDFNSQLAACRPHVGASHLTEGQKGDKQLHRLLETCDLCVLNSWHANPGHTYESSSSRTRIDYVVTKLADAKGQARYAKPNHLFPVKAYSLAGHWPVEAIIPVVPFCRRPPEGQPTPAAFAKDDLLIALHSNSAAAQALQCDVGDRLATLAGSSHDLLLVRNNINQILLDAAVQHFPPRSVQDNRISAQGVFRASAKHTWQLYRVLKAPRITVPHSVFLKWREACAFAKASKLLREQSRQLKRQSLLDKLAEAESAAAKGDQRVLHKIVRSLAPRSCKIISRLRDPQGQPLGKEASLQAMLAYAKDTFCTIPDVDSIMVLQKDWPHTHQEVQVELQKLGFFKAVPQGVAPAALWKCCAGTIAPVLNEAFQQHFKAGSSECLQDKLHDAFITLIPKPTKPPTAVENMRPIGLQCPSAKVIAGVLRQNLLDVLLPLVKDLPQYAYARQRGTFDAILRVHMHFEEARVLLRTNCVDRFQQYEGNRKLACIGALSLSLDLSKAYDLTSRPIVYGTLAEHGVDPDTIQIIQQLHLDAQYVFRAGDSTKGQTTTNGLKQGCCIAPFLWSFYTVALMHALRNKLGPHWLQQTLVLFADDHWCHWLIRNRQDWQNALAQLVVVLETLVSFKMSINYRKTAILLRLEGKEAKAIMYEHTRLKNGVRHLVITVCGREELIPIKDEHEYLGTKVTYHHRLDRNLRHRLQAGQAKYQAIRKPLNGHHHLSTRHRERLWRACVSTSMLYSLPAVGVTGHGLDKLTKACTRHLRAIQRQPAHLTHLPNTAIWQQAAMDMPGRMLLKALTSFRENLQRKAVMSPDITTQPGILDHLCHLEAQLQHQVQQQEQHDANVSDSEVPQIPCPECDAFFLTENAMRIHCQVSHGILPPRAACEPTKFVPRLHACGGLPRCQLCLRSFYRWQNLKQHIESGACTKLGGESQSKCPDSCRDSQVTDLGLPTASEPTDADHGIKQNVPLVDRQLFRSKQHDWESLLRDSALRVELRSLLEATEVNPEASIFAFCDPSLLAKAKQETKQEVELDPEGLPNLEEANQPPKRPRPEPNPLFVPNGNTQLQRRGQHPFAARGQRGPKHHQSQPLLNAMDPNLRAIIKLMLQHEDMLAAQRVDKVFILFVRQDYASIIPNLHSISQQFHQKTQDSSGDPQITSPLRTLLMACLIRENLARIQKMVSTSEGQGKLQAAGWMNDKGDWTFLKFCHKTRKLVQDTSRTCMSHQEIVRQYTFLLENMKGEIVQQFNSTQSLKVLEAQTGPKPQATFILQISLRGERANEMHETMCTLLGSATWQLVGVSLKRGTLKRSPLAEQLAQLVYGR